MNNYCTICFKNMVNVCSLECTHSFCYTCLEKWSIIKETCPICRSNFSFKEKKKNIRITRSMSLNERTEKVNDIMIDFLQDLRNNSNNDSLEWRKEKQENIFKMLYEHNWIFKCENKNIPKNICNCSGCLTKNIVRGIFSRLPKERCKSINIWKFKFRKILEI